METKRSPVKPDQILAAAQKRFGHYGLSKTTMNEIADDIRMSKASLYYYFKNKENVFISVAEKEQEYFVREMKKIIHSSFKAKFMLMGYIDLRIKLLKKLLTLGKFSYDHYMEVRPLLNLLVQKFRLEEIKMIAEIIKIGMKRKEFSVVNINKYAEFFIDIMRGIRQTIISEYTDGGMVNISRKQYQKLKLQSRMFTELFIKGISI